MRILPSLNWFDQIWSMGTKRVPKYSFFVWTHVSLCYVFVLMKVSLLRYSRKAKTQTNTERDWQREKGLVDYGEVVCLFSYVICVDDHVHVGRWLGSCGSLEACEMINMWGGQPIPSAEWVERHGAHGVWGGHSQKLRCSAEAAFHLLRFQQSTTLKTAGRPGYSYPVHVLLNTWATGWWST